MKADNCAGFHCRSFRSLFLCFLLLLLWLYLLCFLWRSLASVFFYVCWGFVFFFLYTPVILAAAAIMEIISHVFGWARPFPMALDELHSAAAQAAASAPSTSAQPQQQSRESKPNDDVDVGIDNGNWNAYGEWLSANSLIVINHLKRKYFNVLLVSSIDTQYSSSRGVCLFVGSTFLNMQGKNNYVSMVLLLFIDPVVTLTDYNY